MSTEFRRDSSDEALKDSLVGTLRTEIGDSLASVFLDLLIVPDSSLQPASAPLATVIADAYVQAGLPEARLRGVALDRTTPVVSRRAIFGALTRRERWERRLGQTRALLVCALANEVAAAGSGPEEEYASELAHEVYWLRLERRTPDVVTLLALPNVRLAVAKLEGWGLVRKAQ